MTRDEHAAKAERLANQAEATLAEVAGVVDAWEEESSEQAHRVFMEAVDKVDPLIRLAHVHAVLAVAKSGERA